MVDLRFMVVAHLKNFVKICPKHLPDIEARAGVGADN
jgi:hypothetical protein